MRRTVIHTDRGKAAALTLVMALFLAASGYVVFTAGIGAGERWAAIACTALFAWGFLLAAARTLDPRPALLIDEQGIRDRRMKINAPWGSIRGVRVWAQEADIARTTWIALDVDDVSQVRALHPLWASVRRATLERWGRPPVALNVMGLDATVDEVLAAIAGYRPDLIPDVHLTS